MRRSLFVLSIILALYGQIYPTIYEIESFKQIAAQINVSDNPLILFDIDETLLRGCTQEATHTWFCTRMNTLLTTGLAPKDAADLILPEYIAAQCTTKVMLIDEYAPTIIYELQKMGLTTLVITSRGREELVAATLRQFADLGLSFAQTEPPFSISCMFNIPGYCCCYKDGVIFCDGNKKSVILEEFFKQTGYLPNYIVLVDDDIANIRGIEAFAQKLNIRFDGFHFTGAQKL